ncbi:MAG: hypothetical protein ACOCUD_04850 [Bacillota bacterium]
MINEKNKPGRPKVLNNPLVRTVMMEEEDFKYLKSNGINLSKFVRQAVDKQRIKGFYKH